jgi:hypothetical protein
MIIHQDNLLASHTILEIFIGVALSLYSHYPCLTQWHPKTLVHVSDHTVIYIYYCYYSFAYAIKNAVQTQATHDFLLSQQPHNY